MHAIMRTPRLAPQAHKSARVSLARKLPNFTKRQDLRVKAGLDFSIPHNMPLKTAKPVRRMCCAVLCHQVASDQSRTRMHACMRAFTALLCALRCAWCRTRSSSCARITGLSTTAASAGASRTTCRRPQHSMHHRQQRKRFDCTCCTHGVDD